MATTSVEKQKPFEVSWLLACVVCWLVCGWQNHRQSNVFFSFSENNPVSTFFFSQTEHAGGGSFDTAISVKLKANKWMRNAGLAPGKTQNSVNQPLLDPAGQKREFKNPPSSPTRASIKEKLMIQAGILNAETHNEDHHPLYRYHFDGTERITPPEWRCCCGVFFRGRSNCCRCWIWIWIWFWSWVQRR